MALDYVPDFSEAISCTPSVHGIGGVLFLHWPGNVSVVVKALPDAQEAVSSLFCRSACHVAGARHPDIELLWMDTERGRGLLECVESRL